MVYTLTDHVHVVTITQNGQTVSEAMSYRQAFALQSFQNFLVSSRASLVYRNGSEPSHYATGNLFL